jgi:hypothetical protein
MQQGWKWVLAFAVVLPALAGSIPAFAQDVPNLLLSSFIPQSGVATEGAAAIANARRCPNIDGPQVLRLAARLKIQVIGTPSGLPMSGIPASDICVLFNGGTPAQGFSGTGDDSIIANFQYNPVANCPNVLCVQADAPTDVLGITYITWIGHNPADPPGVVTNQSLSRDPLTRKWGGYAGDIPVRVMVGGIPYLLEGRLTTLSPLGSYTAHVKSLDHVGGRTTATNQGEVVNSLDINPVQAAIGTPYKYHLDFDNNGTVNAIDLNFIKAHNTHKCNSPIVN